MFRREYSIGVTVRDISNEILRMVYSVLIIEKKEDDSKSID